MRTFIEFHIVLYSAIPICSFVGRNSFVPPLPRLFDNGIALGNRTQNVRPVSVHPMPSADVDQPKEVTLVASL